MRASLSLAAAIALVLAACEPAGGPGATTGSPATTGVGPAAPGEPPFRVGSRWACSAGMVAVYDEVFYPPFHHDEPGIDVAPDRCFHSEADARAAGARQVPLHDAVVGAFALGPVLHGIGVSTDPYGDSRPAGVGIAWAQGDGLRSAAVRRAGLGREAAWLGPRTIIAARAPGFVLLTRRGQVLREDGAERGIGRAFRVVPAPASGSGPVPVAAQVGERRIAVFVGSVGGLRKVAALPGVVAGWDAAGDLLVWWPSDGGADLVRVDPDGGGTEVVVRDGVVRSGRGRTYRLGWARLAASADGRFLATVGDREVFVLSASFRVVRVIRSPFTISMVAWSPRGHRLAYTTSGFPDPHELFVASPGSPPAELFSQVAHFDWITWSPDGRWLLADDEPHERWLLVDASGAREALWVPRFGGRPLWCCLGGSFAAPYG